MQYQMETWERTQLLLTDHRGNHRKTWTCFNHSSVVKNRPSVVLRVICGFVGSTGFGGQVAACLAEFFPEFRAWAGLKVRYS